MKPETEKEFVCRACLIFLDSEDLVNGACPDCKSDENVFFNDLTSDNDNE